MSAHVSDYWQQHDAVLKARFAQGTSLSQIAQELGKTKCSVRSRAERLRLIRVVVKPKPTAPVSSVPAPQVRALIVPSKFVARYARVEELSWDGSPESLARVNKHRAQRHLGPFLLCLEA